VMWFGDPGAVYCLPLDQQVEVLGMALARLDGDVARDSLIPETPRDRLHFEAARHAARAPKKQTVGDFFGRE
jgi:hypothetical protein